MNIDFFRKRLSYSLAFCFLCLGSALSSAEPNFCPQIAFDFELRAKDYLYNYSDSTVMRIRQEVARDLDSLCLFWFPFLEGNSEEGDSAKDSLIVVMTGRDEGAGMPYQKISLAFEGEIRELRSSLYELGDIQLYKPYESQPTQDSRELRRRINESLSEKFGESLFRQALMDYFLSNIPLADTLRPIPDNRQIAIPVACPHLNVAEESEFGANCNTLFGVSGGTTPMKADMRLILRYKADGELICDINSFHCGPIKLEGSPYWDDSIMTVFDRLVEGTLTVFLSRYNRDLFENSNDNIITDLEGDD
jgi:hypothetical protein